MSEVATVSETTVETPTERKPRGPSPSSLQFGLAWNASNSRKEVLENLKAQGFNMTYSAMSARVSSYKAKGMALKDIPQGKRGRKIDVASDNAKLAEAAAAASVSESEQQSS